MRESIRGWAESFPSNILFNIQSIQLASRSLPPKTSIGRASQAQERDLDSPSGHNYNPFVHDICDSIYVSSLLDTVTGQPSHFQVHVVQISQNSDFMSDVTSLIPTLLRKSTLWRIVPLSHDKDVSCVGHDVRFDRPMLAEEHIAAQGVPVPCLLPQGHVARIGPLSTVFGDVLCSPTELRHLAGNAMHLSSVGSVLLFMLMTITPSSKCSLSRA